MQLSVWKDELIDFIQVTDYGEYASISFSQPCIDILKKSDVASTEEITEEIINRITEDDAIVVLNNASYILDIVDQAECQILCEKFLSDLTNLIVDSHTLVCGKNDLTIETKLLHCNKGECTNCFDKLNRMEYAYPS
jgi:hypothetical protein